MIRVGHTMQAGGQFGLPEVNLGIIPGSGGTQRLPRLVGVANAAELIATGRLLRSEAARDLGIVDRIVAGEGQSVFLCRAAFG